MSSITKNPVRILVRIVLGRPPRNFPYVIARSLSRILSLFTLSQQSLECGVFPDFRTRQTPETRRQVGFYDARKTGPLKRKKMGWNLLFTFAFISTH